MERASLRRGELQLTDYGISGIPIFQVSRFATKALKRKQTVTAQIDFLPKLSEQEIEQLFEVAFENMRMARLRRGNGRAAEP